MKLRLWFVIATCSLAAGALFVPISSRGQEDVLIQPPSSDSVEHVKVLQRELVASPFEQRVNVTVQLDPVNQLRQAAAKIRDAESDAAKSAAKEELTAKLDQYFEDDMARRVEELAKVEERVNRLRALLEKRKSKKQEIIDLQMKVLENEADGLGFFNGAQQPGQAGGPLGGMRGYGIRGRYGGMMSRNGGMSVARPADAPFAPPSLSTPVSSTPHEHAKNAHVKQRTKEDPAESETPTADSDVFN